jgi:hypothetical protein
MAVNTAATTTYSQIGIREDLSDMIYDISPTETPIFSALKKGKAMTARKMEWQKDSLAAAAVNKAIEGDDPTYATAVATSRIFNYAQTFSKAIIVSDIANTVSTAGRKEEMAYQLAKRSKEIKRDMEFTIAGNYASLAGSTSSAGTMGTMEAWIETCDSRGSGGADGGVTANTGIVEAATDASSTNQRTFTEARLKAVIKLCWDAGGDPTIVNVGSFNKQQASAFAGIATKYQDLNPGGKSRDSANIAILGAADVYVSDFGQHRISANRFSRARTALVLDREYWSLHYLEPFHTLNLARTGMADRRMLVATASLCCKNEAASGVVADLTTS